jgi:hypothetical protein
MASNEVVQAFEECVLQRRNMLSAGADAAAELLHLDLADRTVAGPEYSQDYLQAQAALAGAVVTLEALSGHYTGLDGLGTIAGYVDLGDGSL